MRGQGSNGKADPPAEHTSPEAVPASRSADVALRHDDLHAVQVCGLVRRQVQDRACDLPRGALQRIGAGGARIALAGQFPGGLPASPPYPLRTWHAAFFGGASPSPTRGSAEKAACHAWHAALAGSHATPRPGTDGAVGAGRKQPEQPSQDGQPAVHASGRLPSGVKGRRDRRSSLRWVGDTAPAIVVR